MAINSVRTSAAPIRNVFSILVAILRFELALVRAYSAAWKGRGKEVVLFKNDGDTCAPGCIGVTLIDAHDLPAGAHQRSRAARDILRQCEGQLQLGPREEVARFDEQ